MKKNQVGKQRRRRVCLALCLTATLLFTGVIPVSAAGTENGMNVSFKVDGSYTVTIPKAVTIYPSTDFRLDGELAGTAEGGKTTIAAVTNTEPGYSVRVRVKPECFNTAGNAISLKNKTDSSQTVTTKLSVRNTVTDELTELSRTNNIAAEFYGLTGASNFKVDGGSLYFSAPDEAHQSGEYEGNITFEISYEK